MAGGAARPSWFLSRNCRATEKQTPPVRSGLRADKEIYALGHVEGGKTRLGAIDAKTGAETTIYEYGPEVLFATAFNPAFP